MSNHRWSTGLGFTLGAVGTAVGLGSIWRFPYLAGAGRRLRVYRRVRARLSDLRRTGTGRRNPDRPVVATESAAGGRRDRRASSDIPRVWNIVGWTGSLAGFLILTYYTMIAGWVMAYTWFFLIGKLRHRRRGAGRSRNSRALLPIPAPFRSGS